MLTRREHIPALDTRRRHCRSNNHWRDLNAAADRKAGPLLKTERITKTLVIHRLTKCCTTVAMADTITFRPDGDTLKALEVLTRDGTAVSAAVRSALIDAARRKATAIVDLAGRAHI
ncbi:hypothetical protein BST40_27830 [Mycobacterium persicum]|nr:hypothetical protein BST40_27830 [Mycobacterium persicum]